MSLYRQLIIFTFLLFVLLFMGTWYAKVQSTRTFLINQLESHAQDTATSLSLSVSTHAAAKDMSTVESMINAVFDRGYYQIVRFTDPRGNALVERALDVKIENVPTWFIKWLPLNTPEANSYVMAGWRQAGTIFIKSHPGYAYATLWNDVRNMTTWFAACAAFVLIAGGLGLRILLRPLVNVERQADAICKKEYRIQDPLPWTKELRSVVQAMNRMTRKVKEMFEEQVAQAEGLRERAYHDQLTGLGNRRYFESQINSRLDSHEISANGAIILLRIHNLETLNRERGFQSGDNLLQRVAALLQETTKHLTISVSARLTGGDFGVFIPDVLPLDADLIVSELMGRISQLSAEEISLTDNIGNAGVATYDGLTTISMLLSEADLALGSAMQKGPNDWDMRVIAAGAEKAPIGLQQWKETLTKALKDRRIFLEAQPVVKCGDITQVIHMEIFARIIHEDGTPLKAASFLPLAERLDLVATIDRIVIEETMKTDFKRLGIERIAFNLSPASLRDDSFKQWITTTLQKLQGSSPHICFEFPEYAAIQNLPLVRDFSSTARKFGHSIGLDHYGQSFSKLGYLQSLHPEYVKIDRAYTGELDKAEGDSRFYIGALCSVAHSIDITVVAEGVESEQQMKVVSGLNVDGAQGFLCGKPMKLGE